MSKFTSAYLRYKCNECNRKVDLVKMDDVLVMSRHFHPSKSGFCQASLDQVNVKELGEQIKKALKD